MSTAVQSQQDNYSYNTTSNNSNNNQNSNINYGSNRQMHPRMSATPLVWTYIVILTFMLLLSLTCYLCRILRNSGRFGGGGQGSLGNRGRGNHGAQLQLKRLPSEMKIVVQPDGLGFGYAIKEEFFNDPNKVKKSLQNQEKSREKQKSKDQPYFFTTDAIYFSIREDSDVYEYEVHVENENFQQQNNNVQEKQENQLTLQQQKQQLEKQIEMSSIKNESDTEIDVVESQFAVSKHQFVKIPSYLCQNFGEQEKSQIDNEIEITLAVNENNSKQSNTLQNRVKVNKSDTSNNTTLRNNNSDININAFRRNSM